MRAGQLLISLALCLVACRAARTIDVVTPVAGKDATIYRFNLRHILKHVQGLRNVYVVCRVTDQMKSIILQANEKFVKPGQEVVLVDESIFPYTFDSIRDYLKTNRPTEGFDGQPFDATVVVPDVCSRGGPKQSTKEWVHVCRQPFKNETVMVGKDLKVGNARVQTFDRTGWVLQQLLKLGCSPDLVPGIGPAYLVVDADTIFYQDYAPVPPDDARASNLAYNYMPGDPRDCANPPYFMTLDALGIPNWDTASYACAGRGPNRKCKTLHFCPIAHGMVYSQEVLQAFRKHVEARVADSQGQPVQWWQAILQVMPAWHTSPFSEYITYYAFAHKYFPNTVRVYDEAQMGASHAEVAPNYYMGNGLGVSSACHLTGFAGASPADRPHHAGAVGYCASKSGKRVDACEFYKPDLHGGADCPAPKYESYHGFRNAISSGVDSAFAAYDAEYWTHHATSAAAAKLRVVGRTQSSEGGAASALRAAAEASPRDAALDALDKKLTHGAHA